MTKTLLQTKLYIPPSRPSLVSRPHLMQRLQTGAAGVCTLVAAPAGFGKTTLVTAWLRQVGQPVAWLSLDEDDNEVGRFLRYLIAALQRGLPEVGREIQEGLVGASNPSWPDVLTLLFNELTVISTPIILALDDYHLITNPAIHEMITFWLNHAPAQCHLVLTSRSEPPLPLSRLRARGLVAEILADELRFAAQDAATFLNEMMGLSLSQDNIHALELKTEGWVTGLQMAALSLQRRGYAYGELDVEQFITTFTGSHRYILDYLADEVLAHLPDRTQQFLWQTAVLDRLSAPLCAAVTGQTDSQLVLDTLDNANLFIIPLDDQRQWYRYHHLFQELLRHRLEAAHSKSEIADLHRHASSWFQQNDNWEEAFDHLCAAEDMDGAVKLMRQRARTMLGLGEISLLLKWVTAVPKAHILEDAELALYYAWTTFLSLQWDELDNLLAHIEQQLAVNRDNAILCETLILHGSLARYRGQAETMRALFQHAEQLLPPQQPYLQGLVILNLGLAHIMFDEMAVGLDQLQTAVKIFELDTVMWVSRMFTMFNLAQVQMMLGQYTSAKRTYQSMLQLADKQKRPRFAGLADVGLAWLCYVQNELDSAKAYAESAKRLSQISGAAEVQLYQSLILARIYNAQGDRETAMAMLREGESLLTSLNDDSLFAGILAENVWLALHDDGFDRAVDATTVIACWQAENRWLAEGSPNHRLPFPGHPKDFDEMLQVRLWLKNGRLSETQPRLQSLLIAAEAAKRIPSQIEIKILQAIMFQAQAQHEKARATLQQALQLAQSEQMIRPFADKGQPVANILQTLPSTPFQRLVLSAFPNKELKVKETLPYVDALSQRELEVLRLIATGLTNRQAAKKLIVAPSTIKKHLENIYSKLDVHNRTEAVRIANKRNLI